MAADLGSAYLQIVPSMKGFGSTVAKEVGGGSAAAAGSKFGGVFSGGFAKAIGPLAGIAAAGVGISKLTGFIGDSISAVGNWQALNAQSASVVKATGAAAGVTAAQVHNLATSIEGQTSTQAESIQQGANMLLTFKNIRNEAGKGNDVFNQSTKTLVDMSRAMGTEPQQAAIQLGKALNDPVKGISALSRVGVTFTDQQKSQIKALVASGNTMKAQKIILGELNSEFGGSGAAYRATFPGQVYQMKDAIGDFGEAIATAAMPALTVLVGALAKVVAWATNSGIIENVAAAIGKGFSAAKGAISDFLDGFSAVPGSVAASLAGTYGGLAGFGAKVKVAFLTIRDTVDAVIATIGPVILSTFGGIAAAVGPALAPLGAAFQSLLPSILSLLPALSPVGLIFQALLPVLPALAGLVAQLAAVLGGVLAQAAAIVVPLVGQIVSILSGSFVALMPTVVALVGAVGNAIGVLAPVILGVVAALAPLIVSLVSQLAPIIVSLVSSVLPPLIQAFSAIIAAVLPLITMIAGLLIPIIKAILPVVIAVFSAIVPVISAAIQIVVGVINLLLGILTGNWSQVWNGLVGIVSGVWNLIVGVIKGAIGIVLSVIGAVLSIIGTLFAAGWNLLVGIVRNVWNLIVGAVTAYINTLMSNIRAGLSLVTSIWNGAWKAITGFIKAAWTLIVNAVKTGVTTVINFIKTLPQKAVAVLSGLGKTLFNSGKALINGFIDGIKSMIGAVGKVASDVVGTVAKFFPHSPAKEGPLSGKGYTSYSGKALALDFAGGMTSGVRPVRIAASGLTAAAALSGATAGIAASTAAPAGTGSGAGSGFPGKVTLIDRNGSLLGHMDARIDRYDLSQQLAGAR